MPAWGWTPAIDPVGGLRDGADLADVTGVLDLARWPAGMRVLDAVGTADLTARAAARARAREVAWLARGEVTGTGLAPIPVAGRDLLDGAGRPVLVIDMDATIVIAHSEKEQAAATFKRSLH